MSQRLEHEFFFEYERATFQIGQGFGVAVRLIDYFDLFGNKRLKFAPLMFPSATEM